MFMSNAFINLEQAIEKYLFDEKRKISEWEKEYYLKHKKRYRINLEIVMRYAKSKRILEIGSVPCHFTSLLHLLGYKVFGIDPKPERSSFIIDHFSLDVIKCDIENDRLPFEKNTFETIVFSEVIEHLYINPIHALKEICRVLIPHGRLLLFTDNLYSLHVCKNFLMGQSINNVVKEWEKLETIGHRGHIRLYSTREVKDLLSLSGMKPVSHHYFNYNESIKSNILYFPVPKNFYPSQLIISTKEE